MPRTYDAEFRRRVLELVRAGQPVLVVAAELGLAQATVYRRKAPRPHRPWVKPGTSTSEQGELATARRRIRELETETGLGQAGRGAVRGGGAPKSQVPGHR